MGQASGSTPGWKGHVCLRCVWLLKTCASDSLGAIVVHVIADFLWIGTAGLVVRGSCPLWHKGDAVALTGQWYILQWYMLAFVLVSLSFRNMR